MASLCVGVDMAPGFVSDGKQPRTPRYDPGLRLPKNKAMVRWIDGFYGGLIAGVTSAAFFAAVAVAWLHEASFSGWFAQIAHALAAGRLPSMLRAPTSVVWGLGYGLLVWWLLNDVVAPISGAIVTQPLWVGLAGAVLGYGVVLSELTAMAARRGARFAP